MTAPVDQQQATALLTLVNTELAAMTTARTAYETDSAPTSGGDYVSMTLSRRYAGNRRVVGVLSPSGWRLALRAVGTSVANARILLVKCSDAVEGQRITVGDVTSTPIQFETEDAIRQDEEDLGLWSGMRTYTYSF